MRKWTYLTALIPPLIFPLITLTIGLRNPAIFNIHSFLNAAYKPILFSATIIVVIHFLDKSGLLRKNLLGLILLFSFTFGYFLLGNIFNSQNINTNNIYFEADNSSWLQRMALQDGWNTGTRAVHPFSHLIFRPLVLILTLITGIDRFYANILLLALAGGSCVFLMWKIISLISGDEMYAALFASLLGYSASHLIFSSVIETYIFSAFCLIFFIWLLINNKSIYLLAALGITTFGITITNIIQQGVMELIIQKKIKQTIGFFVIVILIGSVLNMISKSIYPSTEYVFLPKNILGEQKFRKKVDLKRAGLMVENLFIYNIAAPQPYTAVRNELPRFNFLNGTIKEYAWFGWPALVLWLATIGLSLYYFFNNNLLTTTSGYLSISIITCLVFNFILHINYGSELFLYSADWTYAVVLFSAINLIDLSKRNWFIYALFIVLLSVIINNMWFLYFIAKKSSGLSY